MEFYNKLFSRYFLLLCNNHNLNFSFCMLFIYCSTVPVNSDWRKFLNPIEKSFSRIWTPKASAKIRRLVNLTERCNFQTLLAIGTTHNKFFAAQRKQQEENHRVLIVSSKNQLWLWVRRCDWILEKGNLVRVWKQSPGGGRINLKSPISQCPNCTI